MNTCAYKFAALFLDLFKDLLCVLILLKSPHVHFQGLPNGSSDSVAANSLDDSTFTACR